MKKKGNTKCWQECRATRTLMLCWFAYKYRANLENYYYWTYLCPGTLRSSNPISNCTPSRTLCKFTKDTCKNIYRTTVRSVPKWKLLRCSIAIKWTKCPSSERNTRQQWEWKKIIIWAVVWIVKGRAKPKIEWKAVYSWTCGRGTSAITSVSVGAQRGVERRASFIEETRDAKVVSDFQVCC